MVVYIKNNVNSLFKLFVHIKLFAVNFGFCETNITATLMDTLIKKYTDRNKVGARTDFLLAQIIDFHSSCYLCQR